MPLQNILDKTQASLDAAPHPPELAFYGGTFTSMSQTAQQACLEFAAAALRQGKISAFRCSTRPDCADGASLARLAAAGCTTVELGIQSFADSALAACHRGYDGAEARQACRRVKDVGLKLGVQLLPGLPGSKPAEFIEDTRTALGLGADMLRFYPCLVLRGTGLEPLWATGAYTPLSLKICLNILAQGWLAAQRAGIPVIRMGLAPSEELERNLAAGPRHPALGACVMARALYAAVRRTAAGQLLRALEAPAHCRGYFWGHKGELRQAWRKLGLSAGSVRFTEKREVLLY